MPDRFKRALAFALSASAYAGCAAHPDRQIAPDARLASMRAATDSAANGFATYYALADVGTREASRARNLARRATAGASERCRLSDGETSTRPPIVAIAPLSPAAIAQRVALVRTLGAFQTLVAGLAEGTPEGDLALASHDARRDVTTLDKVAHTHERGDLGIEGVADALQSEARISPESGDIGTNARFVAASDPIVRKLIAILGADAARRRRITIDASKLALGEWIAYGTSTRRA